MVNPITWPAILILQNDDLLYYLTSEKHLNDELRNHFLKPSDTCTLLELTGRVFDLQLNEANSPQLTSILNSDKKLDLQNFNQMVRNHLSARQQCCVLKISINSFQQGFQLVQNTQED